MKCPSGSTTPLRGSLNSRADLAHELRTPIANMLAEAQVALTRERAPNEYREVIESSIVEYERLSEIVDNLLFVARAGKVRQLRDFQTSGTLLAKPYAVVT